MGSEPGMGWNWIMCLAQHCELHVITEGEFREKIENFLQEERREQWGERIHFHYLPIGHTEEECQRIRKMCWNQGDWRFYAYYKRWQKRVADKAREICQQEKIDILHQLNMIGFREPGYLWQVAQETGIPFVWGPIGGLKIYPTAYMDGGGWKMRAFMGLKNRITLWQIKHDRRVSKALKEAAALISSIPDSYKSIKRYHGKESVIIPETGCFATEEVEKKSNRFGGETLEILWVGKFDFRKRLDIALKAVAEARNEQLKLKIYGTGSEKQVKEAKTLVQQLGIERQVTLMGNRPNTEVKEAMRSAGIFLFTSVSEDTSTVVLEAVSNQLPVVCFDACGMAAVIDDKVGKKIPLTHPAQSVKDFAEALNLLCERRELLAHMAANCREQAEELSWERKGEKMVSIYRTISRETE